MNQSLSSNRAGNWLAAVMASLISIMGGIAWTRQFSNLEANPTLLQLLSFKVDDQPWMPQDVPSSIPLVGAHHFGDLTLGLGYGLTSNPYLLDYPAQIPPLGILEYRLLAIAGYQMALYFLILLTLVPILFAGWRILSAVEKPTRIIFLNLFVIMSMGMITNYDRGALYMAVMGLSLVAFELKRLGKPVLSILILVLIFSMKPHLMVLLALPFFRRDFRFAILASTSTVFINFSLFWVFPGKGWDSINGYLTATKRYSGQDPNFAWVVFDGNGVVGGIHKALAAIMSPEASAVYDSRLLKYSALISLLYLLITLPLIAIRSLPIWLSMSFLFATTMMAIPGNRYYTLAWASAAAIYFSAGEDKSPWPSTRPNSKNWCIPDKYIGIARVSVLIMIVGSLTPWIWRLDLENGFSSPLAYFLPQWTIAFATVTCLFLLRRSKSHSKSNKELNLELNPIG